MLLLLLKGAAGSVVEPPAPEPTPAGHGFVMTDTAPRLWWQRKPKGMPEEEARTRIRRVARKIQRIAKQQIEQQPEPTRRQREVIASAIAQDLAQMPGFDWTAVHRAILIGLKMEMARQTEAEQHERERLQAESIRAHWRREDEAIALLLLSA